MSDFRALREKHPKDKDYPERAFEIQCLTRVLDGTLYDILKHPFAREKTDSDEYVKLSDRRPSARTRLCRTVVNDSVAMLFDDDHFPGIECKDETTRDSVADLIKELGLRGVMIEAATVGSVGSVAILFRILKHRVFFDVLKTPFLTPAWKADEPDTLQSVTERYKVKGHALKEQGYPIKDDDLSADFWFQRIWDETAENWFVPLDVSDKDGVPQLDTVRTVQHTLGFVPMVWIKNLPGGNGIDGEPTFPREAIDMQIESDYLLSQGGRGLKYQSDPTLVIKEQPYGDGTEGGARVKGAANALVVGKEGDAKLLEITGNGAQTVLEWVRGLRELALEGAGGNRSNADKISAAQSGRAMELMHQSLINLASKLRISYGDHGLHCLIEMIVRASAKIALKNKRGEAVKKLSLTDPISLRWTRWFAPTYSDLQTEAITLSALRAGNLVSQETAVKSLAPNYDIVDVEEELKQIKADMPPDVDPATGKPRQQPLSQSDD
ncbi:MAG: hypothetical protein JWO52_4053 [Gammaproteobacteria bacterium]|nr:hypothetical protein [Gammaproteobacteria bacterium]